MSKTDNSQYMHRAWKDDSRVLAAVISVSLAAPVRTRYGGTVHRVVGVQLVALPVTSY